VELLHYVQREWARFKDAPLVFVALLILGVTAGWSLVSLYYQGRIADKDGVLDIDDGFRICFFGRSVVHQHAFFVLCFEE
jgi:hypothetical protein